MPTSPHFAPHINQLLDNLAEVEQLLGIHTALVGGGPGRKRNVEVLNKSAIVLVVACWEAFVEDLASAALLFMIENASNHLIFPKSVLERVGSKFSGMNAWQLSGDGWKQALHDNYTEILAKTTGTLNTPRTAQIDELFLKTIGISKISGYWKWKGRNQLGSVTAIDALVTLRGSIAHRVQHSRSVRKKHVSDAVELISRLAAKSTNGVRTHVHACTGKYPWKTVIYRGIQ